MAQYYAFGLLLLYFFLLVGEFFIPSAGLIGIAAIVAALATIAVAFAESMYLGMIYTGTISVTTPIVLYFMIRVWPHTPLGRRILNRRPGDRFEVEERKMRDGTPIKDLIGRTGVAKTDLLPSGMVIIDDQKLDAVSTGMPIDAGSRIVVLNTTAGKVQVRAARADENVSADSSSASQKSEEQLSSQQTLEGSLDSLDLDSLE